MLSSDDQVVPGQNINVDTAIKLADIDPAGNESGEHINASNV